MEKNERKRIYFYSDFLKESYGEKVYKLPINVPGTCPNRDGKISSGGCIYCAESGAGYDALSKELSVSEQLNKNMHYIGEKYKAKKFIAYFQNYTGTYCEPEIFRKNLEQVAKEKQIVEIAVSTRPDCLAKPYLEIMEEIRLESGLPISLELGLQTANWKTLEQINRGHGLAEFIRAVLHCKEHGFTVCAHVILNLPWDERADVRETARILSALEVEGVKLHSLNILKHTLLANMYQHGEISAPNREEYVERVLLFLQNLSPHIAVHRLIGRAPEEISVVENFNASWRSVYNEILTEMEQRDYFQGMHWKGEICL